KKESMGRRLSQLCPLYAMPSSNSSLDYRHTNARIVENGFATTSGLSKSAKVVLVAETWLTYRELAQGLDISAEAARQKAIRGRWPRQRGNDGKARILVDLEAEKAAQTPRRSPDKHLNEQPDERRTFEALEAHIATLKEFLAKAEAL